VSDFEQIAVVGAGAWGTALANIVTRAGRRVTLWSRDADLVGILASRRENPKLPGIQLERSVAVTPVLDALAGTDAVLLAIPAQGLRSVAMALAPAMRERTPLIVCAKGIERGTRRFMTDVIAECVPRAEAVILSGPSFAADVARGLPTAVTLAARDEKLAERLATALGSQTFRPYLSSDVRGVEIGGAAKNVLAIAAGIVEGRRLGASAAAALTTRGFAELMRFGTAYGARPETLTGLSGLGDLILTCSSRHSRNFSLGIALGEGRSLGEAQAGKLVEGVFTAPVLIEMAEAQGVEMPIAAAVCGVLDGRLTIDGAIESLLSRRFRAEG
jgi:glycerol-3-phosphate dehydrogenase (NAD(P)+)